MQNRTILVAAFVVLFCAGTLSADVLINIRTKNSSPTTRPSVTSDVSITAVPGHDFSTHVEFASKVFDLHGSIRTIDNGAYHVELEFTDQTNGLMQTKTSVDVAPSQPCELAGTKHGSVIQTTILTVTQKPEANAN